MQGDRDFCGGGTQDREAVTPGQKLWEDEQGGQRKDLSRDLKDEEELVRGTAWKTASSWRRNNRGLKVWRVSRGGERVRSEFLEEGVGDGRVLWDPHVSLVEKGCRQPWGHQEGMWWASSVCLHFPSDTPMPVSLHICPHLYLNSCPCHSLSLSRLYPVEGSLGLRACGACGQAQSKSGVGRLRNSLEGGDLKESVSGVFEFEPKP